MLGLVGVDVHTGNPDALGPRSQSENMGPARHNLLGVSALEYFSKTLLEQNQDTSRARVRAERPHPADPFDTPLNPVEVRLRTVGLLNAHDGVEREEARQLTVLILTATVITPLRHEQRLSIPRDSAKSRGGGGEAQGSC
eukprot:174736-Pyramimonas_sp.AAC.1